MITRYFFYFLNVGRCRLLIVFMTVQYMLAFMILHANVESVYTIIRKDNYVSQNVNADVYWLNGVVSSYVEIDDKESFLNFVSLLEKNSAVEKVGFLKEGSAITEEDKYSTPLFFVDEVYGAWTYQLLEGEWLDFDKKETQFVLGGEVKKGRQIGDLITLQIPNESDGQKISYESYTGRVVGFLEEPAYIVDLNFAASAPEFDNMLSQYDSVILTNDEELFENQNWRYTNVSLMVKPVDGKQDEAIDYLQEFGECISFQQIKQNSKEALCSEIMQMLPPNMIIMLAVIYGFVGTEYIFIHRSRNALAVYALCGQTKMRQRECILAVNGLPMVVGVIMSYILLTLTPLKSTLGIAGMATTYHFISTFLLLLFFFAIICISTSMMLNRTIVAMYRTG